MKRCLVTGAGGFLGRWLVPHLRSAGIDVHATTRATLDVLDPAAWEQVGRTHGPFELVVHAAARLPSGRADPEEIQAVLATASLGTQRGLDWAAAHGVTRFVYCSSWSVYAPPAALPLAEAAPTGPAGPAHYALGKLWGEQLCHAARPSFAARGASITSLRLSAIYGPGMKSGVAAVFRQRAEAGETLVVSAPGRSADFLYVTDAARAIGAALLAPTVSDVYNIGSGRETTLAELAAAAWLAARPNDPPRIELGAADGARLFLDTTRAATELGFHAEHDVRSGMQAWTRDAAAL